MNNQERIRFIEEYDRLLEKFKEEGRYSEVQKLKNEYWSKYTTYKRELEGITQEEFIETSVEQKKEDLLNQIRR
jgi:hypothetical protein